MTVVFHTLRRGFGLRKTGAKAGQKNEKKTRKKGSPARCHTQDSRYPGVDFVNFQPARYDQNPLTPFS